MKNDGAELRSMRMLLGWSLDEVCMRADIDNPTLSRVERGLIRLSDQRREKVERVLRAELARHSERVADMLKVAAR
jgi:transcriptional regulator with XRE-family HTH domain